MEQPTHSPLGASSAERWMVCPGSTALLETLKLPKTDEPEWTRKGTSNHAGAAECLSKQMDAWEIVGLTFEGEEIGVEDADAIQVYLDACRAVIGDGRYLPFIEYRFSEPKIHQDFYGTLDFGYLNWDEDLLDISDYKNGEGVVVEAEWNPQIMYYAYGMLYSRPDFTGRVRLRIIQPRAFHVDGPVREWVTDAATIRRWAEEELIPAMDRANLDDYLEPGHHCRFCPAKLVCPVLTSLFKAACTANPKDLVEFTTESLDLAYSQTAAVKFYLNALGEEVYRRLNNGETMAHAKMVNKKANRVFKNGAEELFKERFGEQALEPAKLKSPAEMEKIGAPAKDLVKEWAFTPKSGMTVAPMDDPRLGIKVQSLAETYKGVVPNAD